MTTAEPSNSSSSAGPSTSSNSSLFNSDEARFMSDSFCSAESFDPFTVGAPGFKVPNVLPANIGGIGSAPGENGGEGNNASLAGISNVAAFGNDHEARSTAGRGGYGQDRAWQLQQLEALQAERHKFLASNNHQSQNTPQSQFSHRHSLAGPSSLPDTSTIGQSLYRDGPNDWTAFMSNAQQQNNGAVQDGMSGQISNNVRHPITSQSGDLSVLGAHFPSSHQFPGGNNLDHSQNSRPVSYPYFAQQPQLAPQFMPHQNWNGMPTQEIRHSSGVDSGKGRKSGGGGQKGKMTQSQSTHSDLDSTYSFTPAPRPPLPILDVEKVAQANVIPQDLQEAFFSPSIKRLQPHLKELREEQMKRKAQGLSANIRKDRKDAKQVIGGKGGGGTSADDDEDADEGVNGSSGKKKQSHVLLTEAEKKANHIASEQKRRANIRKGYELLCSLVPSLRESMDQDGEGEEEEDDEEEDEDEEAEDGETKRGKKRKPGDGNTTGNAENKSGARSEAMILMKVVNHIHGKIDEHNALVIKKQELQKELAKRYGAEPSCFY